MYTGEFMNKTGGMSVFFEQDNVTVEELAEFSYAGMKSIATHGTMGEGNCQDEAVTLMKKDGIEVVFAENFAPAFQDTCAKTGIQTVVLSESDTDDLFHTFADKDTELYIIDTDEGGRKAKAVSGSLSKSWIL